MVADQDLNTNIMLNLLQKHKGSRLKNQDGADDHTGGKTQDRK